MVPFGVSVFVPTALGSSPRQLQLWTKRIVRGTELTVALRNDCENTLIVTRHVDTRAIA